MFDYAWIEIIVSFWRRFWVRSCAAAPSGEASKRELVRVARRAVHLENSTGQTLRLIIEPIPSHYDIAVDETAEVRGLDPEGELYIDIHENACVSLYSCADVAVLVGGRQISTVPDDTTPPP